jgi:hypothetical protein
MKTGSEIGAVLFPTFIFFKLKTSLHAPARFFFRVGLLLSNGSEIFVIRSSEVQVLAPTIQLHLPVDTDTLDLAPLV